MLVISLRQITSPPVVVGYAVLQGLLLGVASRAFELVYPGIVAQAVVGTFGVFLGMAVLYRARLVRATRAWPGWSSARSSGSWRSAWSTCSPTCSPGGGVVVYSLSDRVGWLPYLFSVVAIIAGALSFILDFDLVERSAANRLPRRYAWYCAFGLLVGLIFLYWQILRLLSYVRR
ncbi:Bax inhibitor-1/YccA family protein [Micromonospora sp. BRA006-A]|nr:Bax inhibitor-1/YccA family protein [Micromonospora sp. BRA006-A]